MSFNLIHNIAEKSAKAQHTRFEHAIDDQIMAMESVKDEIDQRIATLKNLNTKLDTTDKATIMKVLYPEHHVLNNQPKRTMEIG